MPLPSQRNLPEYSGVCLQTQTHPVNAFCRGPHTKTNITCVDIIGSSIPTGARAALTLSLCLWLQYANRPRFCACALCSGGPPPPPIGTYSSLCHEWDVCTWCIIWRLLERTLALACKIDEYYPETLGRAPTYTRICMSHTRRWLHNMKFMHVKHYVGNNDCDFCSGRGTSTHLCLCVCLLFV